MSFYLSINVLDNPLNSNTGSILFKIVIKAYYPLMINSWKWQNEYRQMNIG